MIVTVRAYLAALAPRLRALAASSRLRRAVWVVVAVLVVSALSGESALAQNQMPDITLPDISINGKGGGAAGLATPLQILLLMTVLSLAPYILVMTTSFIRISITLSFLRTAMGTQQVPPTQVLMALSLFMTMYIMQPVTERINKTALQPYFSQKIKQQEFIEKASSPLKDFMFINCRQADIVLFFKFTEVKQIPKIEKASDVPITVLLPAYVVSEIKTSFAIGFLLYIPFLVIDMVVSSVLMSMGMFMLSPMTISLPFKLLLFVMIDGWELIITGLINSFKRPTW
jgi:flagellar biosynthesis protein FliP